MKPKSTLRHFLALAGSSVLAMSSASAATFVWANSNVDGATPAASLNWFNATQGAWTGGTPVSSNLNTIQFFQDTTTALPNTVAHTQAVILDTAGDVPFELGTLTLSGRGSASANANLTMTLSGDALNFSAATGTINLDALNNTRTITYNVNNNIQLGKANPSGNATALTLTGNHASTFTIGGNITELFAGSSLTKSGSSFVVLSGTNNNFTGNVFLNGGTLQANSANALGANVLGSGNNIVFTGSATLGTLSNANPTFNKAVTINDSVIGTFKLVNQFHAMTFTGPLAGSGTLYVQGDGGGAGGAVSFSNAANTFTGPIQFNIQGNSATALTVNSLPDVAQPIKFGGTQLAVQGGSFNLGAGVATPLVFNNRWFELGGSTPGGIINNNNANTANTITINTGMMITTTGKKILTLGGSNTGNNAFNSLIANGTSAVVSITKADAGRWILGNTANSYTGATTISAGTLQVSNLASPGGNSSIGASTGVGSLILSGGTLRYTGESVSTTRNFALTASSTIDASGTGALNFSQTGAVSPDQTLTANFLTTQKVVTGLSSTADLVVGMRVTGTNIAASSTIASIDSATQITLNNNTTGAGSGSSLGFGFTASARTLTLTGTNTGSNTIAGSLQDTSAAGAGVLSLAKTGIGTWVLSGANTNTGATTVSGGGGLILDYTTQDNRKLGTGGLTFTGAGTITLKGGSASTIENGSTSNTALNAGGTFIARDGGTVPKIRLNAVTRAAGGTISFADATIADTDTLNVNNILGGWATLGDNWAVSVNSGADTNTTVTALASYTPWVNTTGSATDNYLLNGSGSIVTTGVAANSVKITNSANSQTLALNALNLTITSASATSLGGIMYAGGSDNLYSITGTGRIVSSTANQELIFAVQTGTLSVSAFVGASSGSSSVTKSGAGTMEISSNNAFTGAVRVNQGVLRLANANATGTNAGGITVQNGAALELTGGLTFIADALTITGDGVSSGGALKNVSGANTYQGAITIGSGGARINNADTGNALTVRGITTASLADVTFGGAGNITHNTTAISGAGGLNKDGAGTLTTSVANTYTGTTTVTAGTLLVNNTTGSGTGTNTVTVGTLGTLGGSGTIAGAVTVNGALKPGNSPGLLTVGSLDLNASASTTLEINGISRGALTDGYDALNVNTGGSIDLGGALIFEFGLSAFANDTNFDLFSFDTTSTSDFDGVTSTGFYTGTWGKTGDIWSLTDEGQTLSFSELNGNLTLVAIPEPRAALLGGLGLLMLLRRRRS